MGFVNNKMIKNKKNYFVSGSLAGSLDHHLATHL